MAAAFIPGRVCQWHRLSQHRSGKHADRRVSVSGCRYFGIFLGSGDSTVVESCTVRTWAVMEFGFHDQKFGGVGLWRHGDRGRSGFGQPGSMHRQRLRALRQQHRAELLRHQPQRHRALRQLQRLELLRHQQQRHRALTPPPPRTATAPATSGTGLNADTALNCYGYSSSGDGLVAIHRPELLRLQLHGNGLTPTPPRTATAPVAAAATGLYAHHRPELLTAAAAAAAAVTGFSPTTTPRTAPAPVAPVAPGFTPASARILRLQLQRHRA